MEEPFDQLEPRRQKDQGLTGKVLAWNLGIMLGYAILSGILGKESSMITDALLMLLQLAINFFLAIGVAIFGRRELVPGFLLSMLMVVIVGFGVCAGKAKIF